MRTIIIGLSVACFAAALAIVGATLRLPLPSTGVSAQTAPAVSPAPPPLQPPSPPSPALEPLTAADRPAPRTVAPEPDDGTAEDAQLLRARDLAQAGDEKGAEVIYQGLLLKGKRRGVAAQKLGKLYLKRGEYARAGEMYRESARILKEENR